MELIERVEQLERQAKALRPELHFPSTAAIEQRLRWLEIVFEEMRVRDNHGVYAETPSDEKLRKLLSHTVYIKQDRISLHSLTADPAFCVAGDMWFRSDLGKGKLAADGVVGNARLLRREGDTIPAAEIASLDASKITSGRFGMAQMPDGASGYFLKGQGAGVNPVYATPPGVPSGAIVMWSGTLASIPAGWVLCDGNSGTPNLLSRFVQGVPDSSTDPGTIGGALQKLLSESTVGGVLNYTQAQNHGYATGYPNTPTSAAIQHPTATNYGGNSALHHVNNSITDIRPLYYEIAFIMKT